MTNCLQMRLSGSGGQGVILATIILAEAGLLSGKNALQSQSYGPEARGGMCKAEAIISEKEIWFTKITNPNFLLALTQESLNKFSQGLAPDCMIMTDSSLTLPATLKNNPVISIPILQSARDLVGKAFTANIVAVGAINAALNLVAPDLLEQAVFMHIPKGTEELNRKALHVGENLITQMNAV